MPSTSRLILRTDTSIPTNAPACRRTAIATRNSTTTSFGSWSINRSLGRFLGRSPPGRVSTRPGFRLGGSLLVGLESARQAILLLRQSVLPFSDPSLRLFAQFLTLGLQI